MKNLTVALLTIFAAGMLHAQSQPSTTGETGVGSGATTLNASADLPVERIGPNDLIGISVYDSPELTRTVRVDPDGTIRLPMLQNHIQASGLFPEQLEKAITAALVHEQVLVDPIVSVSVVEYRSRPISVVGAVRTPVTFQAVGVVTLLEAISQAGGLADNAGPDILVSRQEPTSDGKVTTQIQRIPASDLLNSVDPSFNLRLHGGEVVRVPEAGLVYVVGNVKAPGAYPIRGESGTSVLKLMALTHGLNSYTAHKAFIYRKEAGSGGSGQIPIELKKIMEHKAPDVPLMANDILYVPEANGRKAAFRTLAVVGGIGAAMATTLVYLYR
ncbi:MAG TPA: polysaccharide biosynthesis/export family protein [Terracidiphilus sp.]|nr:polysaccharide biosynthesis/export family protein [Terracidiphilus sp.]